MRAVNLIPPERRRDAGGAAGRSGGAVYVILAGLAGLMVMAGLYAKARHDEADANTSFALASAQLATIRSQAAVLDAYTQFASLRQDRATAIQALAGSRVDWAVALRQIVGALPGDAYVAKLEGLSPGAAPSGTAAPPAATAPGAAAAVAGPTVELQGCIGTHTKVADVIDRLRGITGNPTVALSVSVKKVNPTITPPPDTTRCPQKTKFDLKLSYPGLPSYKPPAASVHG